MILIPMQCIGKSSLEDKRKMINIRIETIDVDIEMSDHTSAPDCIRGDGCGFSPGEFGLLNCSVQILEAYLYISVHYSS